MDQLIEVLRTYIMESFKGNSYIKYTQIGEDEYLVDLCLDDKLFQRKLKSEDFTSDILAEFLAQSVSNYYT